ncbi:MAG: TonB-dependent receptor [Prevotella conceptionensis]
MQSVHFFSACAALFFAASAHGQDTKRQLALDSVQHVREVVVVSKNTFREVIPSQKLDGAVLERLNAHSVADALRYFSGLQIKDYGGVGGLKTVNIRSMGTSHLGIFYDGIELGNAQNGQIDLGQLSLDNVEEITLYNGQKSAIFQPASDFGNAGSVYIRTRTPRFDINKPFNLRFKAGCASSDTYRLSGLWENRLSQAVNASLSVGYLTSSGKYRFRYLRHNQDRSVAYDTTAIRQNGDIWALRAEANVHGVIDHGMWNWKAYTYNSQRGIPGAIVNNVWRRGERQSDHNHFSQLRFQKSFSDAFSTQWLAKYAYYHTHYINNDPTQLPVDNTYKQQEIYLSTANVLELMPNWSVSLSYDFKWNKLDSDTRLFVFPHRFSNFISLATAIDYRRLKLQASVLGTFVKDHTRTMVDEPSHSVFSPALFVNLYPFTSKAFSFRAFAKKSFRMPTFNELYYTEIGNALLKPETAVQYNVGAVWEKTHKASLIRGFRLQLDSYFNNVSDKIVAYPKGQQFRWTMLNLGKVHIKGIDLQAETTMQPSPELSFTGRLQYTYQQARDVTNPSDSYYKHQIPYIPWHSGSAIVGANYKQWQLNYSFIYAGKRYNQQENIVYNYMPAWYTSDLSLVYAFNWQRLRCKLTAEVNNLFAQDYDVILNYPMPKRNYAISIDITL